MQASNLMIAILMMSAITFSQKCLPFLVLSSIKNNKFIYHLAEYLPPSVMLILTLYALKLQWKGYATPTLIPIIPAFITAILHLRFRQTLLSILGGVISYALMQVLIS